MKATDSFTTIAQRIAPGAKLRRRWALRGGVSARVDALEVVLPDGTLRRGVVRQHGAAEWKPLAGDVTSMEFALLKALHGAGMAVPAPWFLDTSQEVLPRPYLVMAFVEGTTAIDSADVPDALRRMAVYLSRLHTLDVDDLALPSLPRRDHPLGCLPRDLPSTPETDRMRETLANRAPPSPASPASPASPTGRPALLHGDFWPGNILWNHRAVAAVVDWEDAAVGDPLSDLAGCRIELLWKYGPNAMETFTEHYLSLTTTEPANLPVWEVYVASTAAAYMAHWGLDPRVEADMRQKAMTFGKKRVSAHASEACPPRRPKTPDRGWRARRAEKTPSYSRPNSANVSGLGVGGHRDRKGVVDKNEKPALRTPRHPAVVRVPGDPHAFDVPCSPAPTQGVFLLIHPAIRQALRGPKHAPRLGGKVSCVEIHRPQPDEIGRCRGVTTARKAVAQVDPAPRSETPAPPQVEGGEIAPGAGRAGATNVDVIPAGANTSCFITSR